MLAQDVGALSNALGRRTLEVYTVLPRKGEDGRGPHGLQSTNVCTSHLARLGFENCEVL